MLLSCLIVVGYETASHVLLSLSIAQYAVVCGLSNCDTVVLDRRYVPSKSLLVLVMMEDGRVA
jgi:hypothetical protein